MSVTDIIADKKRTFAIRGIERRKIFKDDTDRLNFLDRLGKVLSETGTRCFAWALIPRTRGRSCGACTNLKQ